MKITADIFKIDGQFITLKSDSLYNDLKIDKKYTIDFKEYKSKRSIEANRLMWLLIHEIAKITDNDEWDIYISMLEACNIEAEFILALPEAEKSLKQVYRVVKVMDETREVNGKTLTIFKCYLGSSKFSVDMMNKFIDFLIRKCAEYGIDIDFLE